VPESTNFDYKPDDNAKTSSAAGSDTISWTASEYIEHTRGSSWYAGLAVGTIVLSIIVYFLTKDRFATAIIVVLGIIVGSVAHRKPRQVEYQLTNRGVYVGEKFYAYKEFKSFSLTEEGPLRSLMLIPLRRFAAPVTMYLEREDEESVISLMGEHIPMEERSPDRIDSLSRRLRF
jgi:uncharacterized membrane protein YobD (UPF0266 family)